MGNHLLDGGGENQNFENFQEYPSFDNGILDMEFMNSGAANSGVVNPEIMSAETMGSGSVNSGAMNNGILDIGTVDSGSVNSGAMNNGILDIGTMDSGSVNAATINSETINSGTVNPEFVNPEIMNPGIMNPEFVNPETVNPGAVNSEFVNPGVANPGVVNSEFVNPATINSEIPNPEIPVQQTFDSGISDTSNGFEQAIVPGTIDSRSFTHTEAEWQRIQAGEPTVNYVDATDSWDDYREDKPRNFFRTLLAFFVSIIVAGVLALINVMVYDIEYISTMQCLLSMLPPIGLFTCYYYMIGKRRMDVPEGLLLIVVNEILSYIMFHSVMAHNVQNIYREISFSEAWRFVDAMKTISEMKRIYYLHFAIIFGIASLIGIVYGLLGIMGMMEQYGVRRRRY